MKKLILIFSACSLFILCSNNDDNSMNSEPMLNITFIMDSNAERLDNFGDPVEIPEGNAAQNPNFDILGLHFIGLYQDKFTPYENGVTVFSSPTTSQGGANAIDFNQELFLTETNNTISVPLSQLNSGTYEYIRNSIGFQKYSIVYNLSGAANNNSDWPEGISDDIDINGTLASFLGFNTYIDSYQINNEAVNVQANKIQGYFGLESNGEIAGFSFNNLTEGEAPNTTVPNPINDTSPVPEGSCVVTGKFPVALTIPKNPTQDINVQVVISINNSFEWEDNNGNQKYEPLLGEQVVDMGTRGVFPSVQ